MRHRRGRRRSRHIALKAAVLELGSLGGAALYRRALHHGCSLDRRSLDRRSFNGCTLYLRPPIRRHRRTRLLEAIRLVGRCRAIRTECRVQPPALDLPHPTLLDGLTRPRSRRRYVPRRMRGRQTALLQRMRPVSPVAGISRIRRLSGTARPLLHRLARLHGWLLHRGPLDGRTRGARSNQPYTRRIDRSRRRRSSGDKRAGHHRLRRPVPKAGRPATQHTLPDRRDRRRRRTGRQARDLARSQAHSVPAHRLRGGKDGTGNRSDRTRNGTVDITNVGRPVPIYVRDSRLIDDRSIRDVDRANVALAHVVAGDVYLAWPKREPTDSSSAGRATHPGHHGGRIDRANASRARHPTPGIVPPRPTSVMERRETPRRVIDPGPAPRTDPRPMSEAVGRPADRHRRRNPHGSVVGCVLPLAVLIEVFGAGDIVRYVTS